METLESLSWDRPWFCINAHHDHPSMGESEGLTAPDLHHKHSMFEGWHFPGTATAKFHFRKQSRGTSHRMYSGECVSRKNYLHRSVKNPFSSVKYFAQSSMYCRAAFQAHWLVQLCPLSRLHPSRPAVHDLQLSHLHRCNTA
jgi:hypothetical protein